MARAFLFLTAVTVLAVGITTAILIPDIRHRCTGHFIACALTPDRIDHRTPLRVAIAGGSTALALVIAAIGATLKR